MGENTFFQGCCIIRIIYYTYKLQKRVIYVRHNIYSMYLLVSMSVSVKRLGSAAASPTHPAHSDIHPPLLSSLIVCNNQTATTNRVCAAQR